MLPPGALPPPMVEPIIPPESFPLPSPRPAQSGNAVTPTETWEIRQASMSEVAIDTTSMPPTETTEVRGKEASEWGLSKIFR